MTRPREHVRYVIVPNADGNFCCGYLPYAKGDASEQVNMNGQIVIRGSDHFVVYWCSRCIEGNTGRK